MSITIDAQQFQEATIKHQIGAEIPVSVEPCRRDTFAAIALGTVFLHEINFESMMKEVLHGY